MQDIYYIYSDCDIVIVFRLHGSVSLCVVGYELSALVHTHS
jgi:hypothetical protein